MKLAQYDLVKVMKIRCENAFQQDQFNRRAPNIGDIATVVEVYHEPPGYELECSDDQGVTEWLMGFRIGDIELEMIRR